MTITQEIEKEAEELRNWTMAHWGNYTQGQLEDKVLTTPTEGELPPSNEKP